MIQLNNNKHDVNFASLNACMAIGVILTGFLTIQFALINKYEPKLFPEAKKGYEKALQGLKDGDTRGLNNHPLSGNRSGERAADIKRTGNGRGGGRIIYERDGNWNIITKDIITNHRY